MEVSNRRKNECYDCGHVWFPRRARGTKPHAGPPRCPLCRSTNVGPAEEPYFAVPLPIDAYHVSAEAKSPAVARKVLSGILDIVGITGGGALGIILGITYLVIMFAIPIGGILFLWWLSYFFYDLGWWPLGAITRLAAIVFTGGLVMAVLGFVFWLVTIVFLLISGFWRAITAPFGSPRSLTIVLSIVSGLALVAGLASVAASVITREDTTNPSMAEMDAYFEQIEPLLEAFVEDRDDYNTVASRVDSEARSESSPLRLALLYTEWVQAARVRQAKVESQAGNLKQVEPPPSFQQYHYLQGELFDLEAQFLAEIQSAYNVSLSETERNIAYDRAGTFNRQVVETQDRILEEMRQMDLVP